MKFSANLGFLWNNLSLPNAIYAAKAAGFDAVECHFPYNWPSKQIANVLKDTSLEMLGLNTRLGNVAQGDFGLAALSGREDEAKASIREAITYASQVNAKNIHVMAGLASQKRARTAFIENLNFACELAAKDDLTIVIEPLNNNDVPGYFLHNTTQAIEVINDINYTNLKLMFDCYHVQLTEGNLTDRLTTLLPYIGHIQFASVPNRGAPDLGEVDYINLFKKIKAMGWTQPLGAEYNPNGDTEKTLRWLRKAQSL